MCGWSVDGVRMEQCKHVPVPCSLRRSKRTALSLFDATLGLSALV